MNGTAERFTSIRFNHFKAFSQYSISLQKFNILVGPNNSGKSTILSAFRILAEGLRKAKTRNPVLIEGPEGETFGYIIDLSDIPVATENFFNNYDDSTPATVTFRLSNGNELILFSREVGSCGLICKPQGKPIRSISDFKRGYNVSIGFIPILGPVEHNEIVYLKEAARLALLTHRAARNFRNIWYHYPERFDEFRSFIKSSWSGMDIEPPSVDHSHTHPTLHMFCLENRIPREIYWMGYGFQVWCQMLTYIVNNQNSSIFLIDEPDIYLHSDLQRRLISILRSLGPDILIATHSTEIMSEADIDELVVINKQNRSAKRIRNSGDLQAVFQALGSSLNPVLTQLVKTKRILFLEGKDIQIISRFANKLGNDRVTSRSDFTVIPAEGFNPGKIRDFKQGVEASLGMNVLSGVVLDRDYRSDAESAEVKQDLERYCQFGRIHSRKEIENFLLHPIVLTRAIKIRLNENFKRTGVLVAYNEDTIQILDQITTTWRHNILARYIEKRRPYERKVSPGIAEVTITEKLMIEYDQNWNDLERRLRIVPGKDTLSALNTYLQQHYGVSLTATLIIDTFQVQEIDSEIVDLIATIDKFTRIAVE